MYSLLWLTVTKVVFEYQLERQNEGMFTGLTVTKVVFEYLQNGKFKTEAEAWLTVTKVVFEFFI